MSYALPQNGPTHRQPDQWSKAGEGGQSGSGLSEKISGVFNSDRRDSLPMYKDKPAGHGSRRQPWFRKKRTIGVVLGSLAGASWWFGVLSPLSYFSSSGEAVKGTSSSKSGSSWSLLGSSKTSNVNWDERAERVKDAFKISWSGYEKYAWGYDEFHPESKTHKQMTPGGMGWIIVDALDTLMLMNLTTELTHARQWVQHNLTYDQDHDVNTFETTIRMLGGLLSAHYLSTQFEGKYAPVSDGLSDDLYVEKATDLADRLLGAYDSNSGVPYASVNLHTRKGIPSHDDAGASSTAEATSLQLEMKYLAKLTGEVNYWTRSEHVMKVVDDNGSPSGLLPIFIYADQGTFRGNNIRLGSRGDSYYEYLIKQYLQTSLQEPVYQAMWNESLNGVKQHLLTYSSPSNFTILAERPSGLDHDITAKMDHLVCFMPGTIALATTNGLPLAQARKLPSWGPQQEEDMRLAAELTKTCWGMYKATSTGLAPEIAHFHLHSPPQMYKPFTWPESPSLEGPSTAETFAGKEDFDIKSADLHNLQRPETVETLFYMWRITGEEKYRTWGWEMFQAFVEHTAVKDGTGFTSIANVNHIPAVGRDNMESFWLAETLKYFYLLFSSDDILPLTDVVFNTEAHAFPRFQMGKLFTTGWSRKPRDKDGKIIVERAKVEGINAVTGEVVGSEKAEVGKMEVVTKTKVAGEEVKATATKDLARMKTETDMPVAAATEEAKKEVKG
ncbi:hypothetical protein B0A48_07156 [Cryoendolithus antarcticus]|uniref:alpha-1,2-Mannosidase n=1 Tax=Cryoendolithus antarcticus TaxID=1507870 RepID=A0A1V8T802_9PEZI|nr:hypothetical protein B0A48_07156 [Cryoendolithus antarcticus]